MKQIYRLRNIFLTISTDTFSNIHTHYNQTQIILGGKKKKRKKKEKRKNLKFYLSLQPKRGIP